MSHNARLVLPSVSFLLVKRKQRQQTTSSDKNAQFLRAKNDDDDDDNEERLDAPEELPASIKLVFNMLIVCVM